MNEFGDLRGHEFVAKMNGFKPSGNKEVRQTDRQTDRVGPGEIN